MLNDTILLLSIFVEIHLEGMWSKRVREGKYRVEEMVTTAESSRKPNMFYFPDYLGSLRLRKSMLLGITCGAPSSDFTIG